MRFQRLDRAQLFTDEMGNRGNQPGDVQALLRVASRKRTLLLGIGQAQRSDSASGVDRKSSTTINDVGIGAA